MAEYKMCPNTDHAIYILEFIQRNYQKHSEDAGVQKYIEALQMGIDALKNQPTAYVEEVVRCKDCKHRYKAKCPLIMIRISIVDHKRVLEGNYAPDDFFCKEGKRKEKGQ